MALVRTYLYCLNNEVYLNLLKPTDYICLISTVILPTFATTQFKNPTIKYLLAPADGSTCRSYAWLMVIAVFCVSPALLSPITHSH